MKPMEYGNMIDEIEQSRRKIKRLIKHGNRLKELRLPGLVAAWEQELIDAWERVKKS